MIRRTLQFVLMLAVLISATVAQASSMPCCGIAPAHSAAVAPAANSDDAMAHCHGDMQHVSASAHAMQSCASPACASQTDVAITPADETVLLPPAAIASDSFAISIGRISVQPLGSGAHSHRPDLHRYAPVPLRV